MTLTGRPSPTMTTPPTSPAACWRPRPGARRAIRPAPRRQAILRLVDSEAPPLHLFLGTDALHYATRKYGQVQTEIGEWIDTTASIAFPDGSMILALGFQACGGAGLAHLARQAERAGVDMLIAGYPAGGLERGPPPADPAALDPLSWPPP